METQQKKEDPQALSPESVALGTQALNELLLSGQTTVICPKCGEKPTLTMTERGERTIVSCKCRYVINMEINL